MTEDGVVHDHATNDEEDLNDDSQDDDWIEGLHDDSFLSEQDFDDASDAPVN